MGNNLSDYSLDKQIGQAMQRSTFIAVRIIIFSVTAVAFAWFSHTVNQTTSSSKNFGFDERFFEFTTNSSSAPLVDSFAGSMQMHSDQSAAVTPVSAQQLTQQTIQSRYRLAFAKLQQDLDNRIAQMKQTAATDYNNNKRTGSPSIAEIVIKYTTVGNRLQAGADKAFYTLQAQMKHDLRTAGLPMDIANEAEREYKTQIQHKKSELISKGRSKL